VEVDSGLIQSMLPLKSSILPLKSSNLGPIPSISESPLGRSRLRSGDDDRGEQVRRPTGFVRLPALWAERI